MTKMILTDIEGTTTRISFVHDVLFPYAYKKLPEFLITNKDLPICTRVINQFDGDVEAATAHFRKLIDDDVKDSELKNLQGHIWSEGYAKGELKAHIYPDVLPAFKKWKNEGLKIGIYSSGSVKAQKLLFGYTEQGDLNPMIDCNFDLDVGKKIEQESYETIIEQVDINPSEIIFLSDVEAELDAAATVGIKTYRLFRECDKTPSDHPSIIDFTEIE